MSDMVGEEATNSRLWRVGVRARRFMLRTQRGPLRPLWALAYEVFLRSVAASIRRGRTGVYVGGTFGAGEPVFGISDIDLIVVSDTCRSDLRRSAKERWRRLCSRWPPVSWLISDVYFYDEDELHEVATTTCLTYGLDRTRSHNRVPPAAFAEDGGPADEGGLLVRPGLWTGREWRLLAGPDLRPSVAQDEHRSRLAVWLELQFWWRFAYNACLDPSGPHVPYICVKLVSDPARIWLWLAHGEQMFSRRAILERTLEWLPEEEPSLRRALELHEQLHRSPEPPLAELLPCTLRLSERIARLIETQVADAGQTSVGLIGGSNDAPVVSAGARDTIDRIAATWPDAAPRPLVDWRARTLPQAEDQVFAVIPGRADDPTLLAAAARSTADVVYPAVRADGLLAFPIPPTDGAVLRALQCRSSDPVSFAVADGLSSALFPEVPGWSARDCALRAVAEHHAWLHRCAGAPAAMSRGEELPSPLAVTTLGRLLSATRAAAFLDSLDTDTPSLALTLAAAAELLTDVPGAGRAVADDVRAAYEDTYVDGRTPAATSLDSLFQLVRSLPAYQGRQHPTA
jgi:hypothetical protein